MALCARVVPIYVTINKTSRRELSTDGRIEGLLCRLGSVTVDRARRNAHDLHGIADHVGGAKTSKIRMVPFKRLDLLGRTGWRGWQTCPQSSVRLVFAGFRCTAPPPTTPRLLKDTTVLGARARALIRRRPVPVNT